MVDVNVKKSFDLNIEEALKCSCTWEEVYENECGCSPLNLSGEEIFAELYKGGVVDIE